MLFAASNLCRGVAMLVVGVAWLRVAPYGLSQALITVLAVVALMLLHQSFAELLESKFMKRWVQAALLVTAVVAAMSLMLYRSIAPVTEGLLYATLGTQLIIIAAVVFRFSGEQMGMAGWMTGLALLGYAAIQFMRSTVMMRYGTPLYESESRVMNRIWLVGCLLSSGIVAFGYMALSTAKLRIELLWRAQVDELTGLLNRWALKRVAMQEIHRCRRTGRALAVLMMDLDGLKEVNDSAGHGCGDVVLQSVAGVLQEAVRAQDAVGRIGGDEFCILLSETSQREALAVAERLRSEVEGLVIRYRGATVRVQASLGVTSSELSGLMWQTLVDHSDSALYRAKREGKNRVRIAEIDEISDGDAGDRERTREERRRGTEESRVARRESW
jgi:diguanylate cyclase (GGDEF)-like protein